VKLKVHVALGLAVRRQIIPVPGLQLHLPQEVKSELQQTLPNEIIVCERYYLYKTLLGGEEIEYVCETEGDAEKLIVYASLALGIWIYKVAARAPGARVRIWRIRRRWRLSKRFMKEQRELCRELIFDGREWIETLSQCIPESEVLSLLSQEDLLEDLLPL